MQSIHEEKPKKPTLDLNLQLQAVQSILVLHWCHSDFIKHYSLQHAKLQVQLTFHILLECKLDQVFFFQYDNTSWWLVSASVADFKFASFCERKMVVNSFEKSGLNNFVSSN